jgi:predicted protein tyrosine phosphatase
MRIWVSPLAKVHDVARAARPERVVSLLSPTDEFPSLRGYGADRHHKVHLHDIREELLDHVAPTGEHVQGLIEFIRDWRRTDPLLVHCWGGISRSTATAFIAACLHNPEADERAIAAAIRAASPTAYPNTLIVEFADEILARRGRMRAAIDAMGRGDVAEVAEPFFIPAKF